MKKKTIKPIRNFKKLTISVWFLFYKPETEKTKPKPKKTQNKPKRNQKNQAKLEKKTEPNKKIGFCSKIIEPKPVGLN